MGLTLSVGVDALAHSMALFVISIGLSLTMGLMRIVNLAHGAFAMIGGYLAAFAMASLGLGFWAALPLAIVGAVLIALPTEALLYRRLYASPEPLTHVLLTIGLTFLVVGLVNELFGPTSKAIPLPPLLDRSVDLGFRTVPAHRLFVIASGVVVAIGLYLLLELSRFGVRLRAAIDDVAMTDALGVRTERLFRATFALAVGLSAFGAIIAAPTMPIEPYYALRYMVTFLVVVSVGGAGSIPGALAAALALGFADTLGKFLVPNLGEFFFYLAVILIVWAFPRGLLARRA